MIAVSNTTPLRYLIAIEEDRLLGLIFETVLVPVAVRAELMDAKTPENVRRWITSPPPWVEFRTVPESRDVLPVRLHAGERESILLAEAVRADVLLIDELAGRTIAMDRKLSVSGTLGLLERADTVGLLKDFEGTIKKLRESGFFIGGALQELLMERHRWRHTQKL
ncbi:MAG TPA: hypothetical protein VFW94_14910 [Candidatus Acidoferrales bacterium]|nr:hypothetical protein [Candidatus Acidoferrales bacterium]